MLLDGSLRVGRERMSNVKRPTIRSEESTVRRGVTTLIFSFLSNTLDFANHSVGKPFAKTLLSTRPFFFQDGATGLR